MNCNFGKDDAVTYTLIKEVHYFGAHKSVSGKSKNNNIKKRKKRKKRKKSQI